ncbi:MULTISPECIES: hypothetical protein [unclassified Lysobacter]|uniref:hypothetical protein n=1 Tax=unclassified Lysobacter TaxID=2635362 RepID=UPI001BE9639A|nr:MULTISPECIES: hypothetical protein [unclassified Lysobacter]MBT2748675.1 hypothetical protein [Lysobacter sp. ISL-42]MBT2751610.1 hypothetical protein [Lysobacter sp. ISL-50]MBT2775804.1 hypothetical protein [Lysobacter sp. ISL-54]MBT2782231.1 hypothetical protein [Lysobacter sp. ISL-52]
MTRSVQEVAAGIKRYCDTHPDACDTLEGIAWWLVIQRSAAEREVLEAAVDYLIKCNMLTSYRLNDGTTLFGCSGCAVDDAPGMEIAAKERGK